MKYVMITGATGGLGKAFCYNQAKQGKNLILTGRSIEKLGTLKNELIGRYGASDILVFPCDLASSDSRDNLYKWILSSDLSIERVINVAGVDTQMAFSEYTQEKLLFQIKVNFEATLSVTKFVLDNFSDGVDILSVSSMCGVTPMPYFAVYSATKAALINFFDSLRKEYTSKSVKITTLMPGSIPTRLDIIEDIKKQGLTGKLSSKSPEFVADKGIKALEKNKRHCIPGFYNKIVYLLSKITPYCIQTKIIKRKFSNKKKDAF